MLQIWPTAHIKFWKIFIFIINPFVGSGLKKPSLPNNKTAVSRPSYLLGIVCVLFWVSF